MAKDDAVRNQKAFIRMSAVLELQARYHHAAQEERIQRPDAGVSGTLTYQRVTERKRTFEQVIDMLELPIAKV